MSGISDTYAIRNKYKWNERPARGFFLGINCCLLSPGIRAPPWQEKVSLSRSPRKEGSIQDVKAGLGEGRGLRLPPLGRKATRKPRQVRPQVVNLAPFSLSDESL